MSAKVAIVFGGSRGIGGAIDGCPFNAGMSKAWPVATLFLNARRIEGAKFQEGIGQRPPTQQSQHRFIYLVGQVPKESFDIATDEASVRDIAASGPQLLVPHSRLIDFAERDRGGGDA